jgi:hypothetical protein
VSVDCCLTPLGSDFGNRGVVPLLALGYEAADHREGDLNQQGQEHDDEEPQQLPTTRAAPAA